MSQQILFQQFSQQMTNEFLKWFKKNLLHRNHMPPRLEVIIIIYTSCLLSTHYTSPVRAMGGGWSDDDVVLRIPRTRRWRRRHNTGLVVPATCLAKSGTSIFFVRYTHTHTRARARAMCVLCIVRDRTRIPLV